MAFSKHERFGFRSFQQQPNFILVGLAMHHLDDNCITLVDTLTCQILQGHTSKFNFMGIVTSKH